MQVLAHDLRNPLAAISGISMLMLDAPHHNESDREMLQMIKTSADTSANMITDILEVTLGIHATNMQKSETDIQQLLHQCVSLLRFKAEEKQQTIELTHNGPAMIRANSEKLWRVINNLLTNAIKFSPKNTVIRVTCEGTDKGIRIVIDDQGIGIPPEFRDKIFDTFTTAKRYGTSGEQPFGLGLSISRQIVEAHGGTIHFESKAEGGTRFVIQLPAA
jgi:signal transduction histidine kinase